MSHIPPMVPLHEVAKELGKVTHVLVTAARAGQFPPLVKVGAVWYVRKDQLDQWFQRNHATGGITPAQLERIRQAGRAVGAKPRARLRRQPRARTASSS